MGFDDGLKVSLLIKNKDDIKPDLGDPNKKLFVDHGNVQNLPSSYNRSSVHLTPREQEIQRSKERQKLIDEILAKEGLA